MGKLIADTKVNIQAIRCCLCRAWRRSDFKLCKIDTCTYQFYFEDYDTMLSIVSGGSCNLEDHLHVLQPWQEQMFSHNIISLLGRSYSGVTMR